MGRLTDRKACEFSQGLAVITAIAPMLGVFVLAVSETAFRDPSFYFTFGFLSLPFVFSLFVLFIDWWQT
jgi:hypothetical protein